MSELEYIEDYFSGRLSEDDRRNFEVRCEHDDAFAREVSSYILSRQSLQDALTEERRSEFVEQYRQMALQHPEAPAGRQTWFSYIAAAAACILLLIAYLTYTSEDRPEQIANTYIEDHLTTLSTTMGGASDSLAIAVGAFNAGDYNKAERILLSLGRNDALLPETTKYLGLTYLKSGEYEKAIEQFDKLISFTSLYANPGKFYLAITLMKRSANGDVERAKGLLQEVISEKLPGYKEASVWVEDL